MPALMTAAQLVPVARTLLRTHGARGARPEDLAQALTQGRPRGLGDGEALCQEGAPSVSLFVLLRGSVRVTRLDSSGTQRELAQVSAPALIGHMGLVDGSTRSASCMAIGDVGLLELDVEVFRAILASGDDAGSAMRHLILASLIHQLSTANQKVRDLYDQAPSPTESATPPGRSAARPARRAVQEDDILKLAGVLDGWSIDTQGLDDRIEFIEDDDARRTREARQIRRR